MIGEGKADSSKSWHERFVKRGLKRGHFWIWKENYDIRNGKNFVEVNDYEKPEGRVGFDIRSKKIKLKWHWKSVKNPIKFHDESLEEWLLNKRMKGKLKKGERIVRFRTAGGWNAYQKSWHERFVKRGLKRGHFWIWKENYDIRNGKNFVEVNDYEKPEGRVGFDIRSNKVKIRRPKKTLKEPVKFHDESLEEWLIEKVLYHGEKIMEVVG